MVDKTIKIYEQWYYGCKTPEERAKRYETITSNLTSLSILKELLEKEHRQAQERTFSEKDYDCPSWAVKQADQLGALRTYSSVLKLLKFLDQ